MQLASGTLPPDEFGERLAHSYSANGGWYVMLIPPAYQMNGNAAGTGATHFSAWSYDRHVPLGFYGAPFQTGIYYGRVEPVDFAATFACLLGVNQPSASIGHVLTQALKPVSVSPEGQLVPKTARGPAAALRTRRTRHLSLPHLRHPRLPHLHRPHPLLALLHRRHPQLPNPRRPRPPHLRLPHRHPTHPSPTQPDPMEQEASLNREGRHARAALRSGAAQSRHRSLGHLRLWHRV